MSEFVPYFIWIVVLACEATVRLFVHPYDKWMNTGHKYPLSDIEFFSNNDQRFFNVLLCHPTALKFTWLVDSLKQISKIIMNLNASAPRLATRLDDPLIPQISQSELLRAKQISQLFKKRNSLLSNQFFRYVRKLLLNRSEPACFLQIFFYVWLSQ